MAHKLTVRSVLDLNDLLLVLLNGQYGLARALHYLASCAFIWKAI